MDPIYICAPALIGSSRFSLTLTSLRYVPRVRELSSIKAANTGSTGDHSRSLSRRATTMRTKLSLASGATGILAIVGLLGWTASAQAPASAPPSLACDDDPPPDTNQ